MKRQSIVNRFGLVISLFLLSHSTQVVAFANTIFVADQSFLQKNYLKARTEYQAAAEIGNPRAYYQLGAIHHQGLGTEINKVTALVWFSLAAEYHYDNSVEIVEFLMAGIPQDQKVLVQSYIDKFQKQYGQASINAKYFPVLKKDNLTTEVHFGDESELSGKHSSFDDDIDDFDSQFSSLENSMDDNFGGEDEFGGDSLQSYSSVYITTNDALFNKPYFLVVDYDIAPDGSRRDFVPRQTMGVINKGLYELSLSTLPQPKFKGENIHFVNRTFLGIANYDIFRIRRDYGVLYRKVRRLVNKLKTSNTPQDKYQYAQILMNFTWLKPKVGQVDSLLKNAAQEGHSEAQFEYGLKLYREQKDLQQAIYWIARASKEGLSQAEYRLGRILLDSPWVIHDEEKALFWLNSAAEKKHLAAIRKVAELKLLAKDQSLHDVNGAMKYLEQIAESQDENPQFHYLKAIAYNNMQPRQLSKSVTLIREAIDLGEDYNWDVTEWQQLLIKWTSSGTVTVQDL
tara:strand:- start:11812 stop:13347 length:1536 start_codon:yes stop_codon:yes gene_type:complete